MISKLATFFALTTIAYGCAVPVAPTGGPQDSKPPEIQSISPERDAVNVDTDRIRIEFNEYINQGSFQQAFEITPELQNPPTFRWRKKRVDVVLRDTLRDNTTYIITIDNSLRDINGVSTTSPSIVAFSTGPVINKARINGHVISAVDGEPVQGYEVHAFAASDSTAFPEAFRKPDYRTQSGADGSFSFSYLADGLYYLIAFNDSNRNKTPDEGEASGSSRSGWARAMAEPDQSPLLLVARKDTLAPELRSVTSLTSSRTLLTYSEGIIVDTTHFQLADSSGAGIPVLWAYTTTPEAREIAMLTEPLSGTISILSTAADSSGNRDSTETTFVAATESDSAKVEFESFISAMRPDSVTGTIPFLSDGTFGFRTNGLQPVSAFEDGITISDGRNSIPYRLNTLNGRTIRIHSSGNRSLPDTVVVELNGDVFNQPDTVFTTTFVRVPARRRGELSGYFTSPDSLLPVVFDLEHSEIALPDNLKTTIGNNTNSQFFFSGLPDGRYRISAYLDENGNQAWDAGTLFPFSPYEMITWTADTIRVRPRWETVLPDTLSFDERMQP